MAETNRQVFDWYDGDKTHYYYGDPKTIDLAKMREEAVQRAAGKYGSRNPSASALHFHRYTDVGCPADTAHEYYVPEEQETP